MLPKNLFIYIYSILKYQKHKQNFIKEFGNNCRAVRTTTYHAHLGKINLFVLRNYSTKYFKQKEIENKRLKNK